jgi:hypothetical protein
MDLDEDTLEVQTRIADLALVQISSGFGRLERELQALRAECKRPFSPYARRRQEIHPKVSDWVFRLATIKPAIERCWTLLDALAEDTRQRRG